MQPLPQNVRITKVPKARAAQRQKNTFTITRPRRNRSPQATNTNRYSTATFSEQQESVGGAQKSLQNAAISMVSGSVAKARKMRALMILRPIVFISTPPQFIFGFISLSMLGMWNYADSWTWGLANYVLPMQDSFGILWMLTAAIGTISLLLSVIVVEIVGGLHITERPFLAAGTIVLFAFAFFPLTCFLPTAGLYMILIYLQKT